MPFHRYSSYFEPEELSKLTAAYEAAWQELLPESSSLTPDAIFLLKKKLAQIILASACTGKPDIDQLKQIAVRGMSGRISTPDSPGHLAQQSPTAWRHALAHRFHRRVSQGGVSALTHRSAREPRSECRTRRLRLGARQRSRQTRWPAGREVLPQRALATWQLLPAWRPPRPTICHVLMWPC